MVVRCLVAGARQAGPVAVRVILAEAPLHRSGHQVQGYAAGGDRDGLENDPLQRAET